MLSLRRATFRRQRARRGPQHFYPRSPCGERLLTLTVRNVPIDISIHALLAESDTRSGRARSRWWYFYPRSPCGERRYVRRMARQAMYISIHALLAESDPLAKVRHCEGYIFLSTLSLRRATCGRSRLVLCQSHFYPRSPCGERQAPQDRTMGRRQISIHALLAESDERYRLL